MNDEIKGIIEALKNTIKDDRIPYEIEGYECKILLDYIINLKVKLEDLTQYACDLEDKICHKNEEITNLQEENKKYKRYVDESFLYTYEELQDKVIYLQKENQRLQKNLDFMIDRNNEKQGENNES